MITKNKVNFPIKSFLLILAIFCYLVGHGQEEELWFGTYTHEDGTVLQGRYKIVQNGKAIEKLVLEPYGKPALQFDIIKNDTAQNFVELSWPDMPNRIATLIHYNEGYYAGNFEDGTRVLPIVVKKFNFQDAQLQGNWFKPSTTEVRIIENTIRLLDSNENWNKKDNRVCENNGIYSLFCALYESSVEIDGAYRHLRPAVNFVRDAIQKKYPKKYDHVLVDFNSAEETQLSDVLEILETARQNMIEAVKED